MADISRRPRWAPRQKCGPTPKARWGFGSRCRSRVCGDVKTSASRLAAPNHTTTLSPARTCWSPSSTSWVAVRRNCITGET